jgi:hypothetical protein
MAYLMTHFWPNGTEAQYRTNIDAIHPDGGLPAGQIHHAAGPTDGGFLISAIWNSKADAEAFVRDKLSAPVEGGFQGAPVERTAEIANLQSS